MSNEVSAAQEILEETMAQLRPFRAMPLNIYRGTKPESVMAFDYKAKALMFTHSILRTPEGLTSDFSSPLIDGSYPTFDAMITALWDIKDQLSEVEQDCIKEMRGIL